MSITLYRWQWFGLYMAYRKDTDSVDELLHLGSRGPREEWAEVEVIDFVIYEQIEELFIAVFKLDISYAKQMRLSLSAVPAYIMEDTQ